MTGKQVSCDWGKIIGEASDHQLVTSVRIYGQEVHNLELTRQQILFMAEPM